jgi:hypothetical protein
MELWAAIWELSIYDRRHLDHRHELIIASGGGFIVYSSLDVPTKSV